MGWMQTLGEGLFRILGNRLLPSSIRVVEQVSTLALAIAQADAQDLAAQLFGFFLLAGDRGVVQDERVQVAVAGVEHVGDRQAVRSRARHRAQHLGDPVRGMTPSCTK